MPNLSEHFSGTAGMNGLKHSSIYKNTWDRLQPEGRRWSLVFLIYRDWVIAQQIVIFSLSKIYWWNKKENRTIDANALQILNISYLRVCILCVCVFISWIVQSVYIHGLHDRYVSSVSFHLLVKQIIARIGFGWVLIEFDLGINHLSIMRICWWIIDYSLYSASDED